MKTWYRAVCDHHGEGIDIFISNPSCTAHYLSEYDGVIQAWLEKHYGCNLRLVNEHQTDELWESGFEHIHPSKANEYFKKHGDASGEKIIPAGLIAILKNFDQTIDTFYVGQVVDDKKWRSWTARIHSLTVSSSYDKNYYGDAYVMIEDGLGRINHIEKSRLIPSTKTWQEIIEKTAKKMVNDTIVNKSFDEFGSSEKIPSEKEILPMILHGMNNRPAGYGEPNEFQGSLVELDEAMRKEILRRLAE